VGKDPSLACGDGCEAVGTAQVFLQDNGMSYVIVVPVLGGRQLLTYTDPSQADPGPMMGLAYDKHASSQVSLPFCVAGHAGAG
jgi:hypothetical protein